jgi:ferredoxin--NADP+ reductase
MFVIERSQRLAPEIVEFKVKAPEIARRAQAGQFVIVRLDEDGERIPLTIAGTSAAEGTIRLVVQAVGFTTKKMCQLAAGEGILDVVGPLGMESEIENYGTVVCVGGGVGVAPVLPIAEAMAAKNKVLGIIGARNAEMVILENDMKKACEEVMVCTDDGSLGMKGLVTVGLDKLMAEGIKPDLVVAIGPLVMMKAVSNYTRKLGIPTRVSMNPIMVDGTGMCGACRVVVDGVTKFACVHGPEFDGHQVDWDNAIQRSRMFKNEERFAIERGQCQCREK